MTISYPLTMPSSNFVRTTVIARNRVALGINPFTGQQTVYDWASGMWLLNCSLPPLERDDAEQWQAFLMSLRGSFGTFHAGDDTATTALVIATGTPLVDGADQVGFSLVTDGWTPSQTGILKAGDYIQIGTGTTQRLYKIMKDVDSGAAPGAATLDIFPEIRESPAENAPITVANCKGTFRLIDNDVTLTVIQRNNLHAISFSAIEAI
jgi:hypothetical protein